MRKSKASGRPKIFTDKGTLKCLMTIGTSSTDIEKVLNARLSVVARWTKEHDLASTLYEPEDGDDAIKELKEVHVFDKAYESHVLVVLFSQKELKLGK